MTFFCLKGLQYDEVLSASGEERGGGSRGRSLYLGERGGFVLVRLVLLYVILVGLLYWVLSVLYQCIYWRTKS